MHFPPERLANLLGAWTSEAENAMRRALEAEARLGGGGPAALVSIAERPGLSMPQLRTALGLTQPGLLRLVERLEAAGWVRRRAGTGRAARLDLTAAGDRVTARLQRRRAAVAEELLAPLGPDDRERLARLLETLLAARTGDRDDLERLCRLCDRDACPRCPVAGAL
jgi:MarR family transcriptional regulator, negative regulator of the multidrug operon emrRAB